MYLDSDGDLALVEELFSVGVLVDVSLLTSDEIGRVLEVVEHESECSTLGCF